MKNISPIAAFQFTHPGQEHKKGILLPGTDFYFKKWNYNKRHSRKYVRHNVTFLNDKNELNSGLADFWCEWEPNSLAKELNMFSDDKEMPSTLHYPIYIDTTPPHCSNNKLVNKIINAKKDETQHSADLQNTDPFIFGENFYYTCCKQEQTKNLERGSIILFGSTFRNPNKYVLDTVFVVDKIINCTEETSHNYTGIFYDAVLHKIYHGHTNGARLTSNKIFIGATYNNPVNGMYSFFPCHAASDTETYKRIELSNDIHPRISSVLQSRGIYLTDTETDTINLWTTIKNHVLKHGYYLGTKADMPVSLVPNDIPNYISLLK